MVHKGRGCGFFGRCFGSLGEILCLILGDVVAHLGDVVNICGDVGRCGGSFEKMWWLLPQMIYNKTKQKIP